ncbi:MAG: ATP-binding protein, partial [Solirubrobacteraceae bacterium]|nr:ATP-binding protein [Solirubrobacteraceae bacterium]
RRAVRACAARAGAADPEGVAVAVSEALTNAVVHAYAGVAPADIDVTVAVDGDAARVVVADRGRGMRPRADSPGAGLGLPLMAALSREMEVAGRPGGGTRLALWFALA